MKFLAAKKYQTTSGDIRNRVVSSIGGRGGGLLNVLRVGDGGAEVTVGRGDGVVVN